MDWLSQNWIWIVLAIAGFYFMTRMHGMGHGMHGSMGHGAGGGASDHSTGDQHAVTDTAFDPVSRRAVTPGEAPISAVYHGHPVFFESRENRDLFEHDPEKYAAGVPSGGQVIDLEGRADERQGHRHRGGC